MVRIERVNAENVWDIVSLEVRDDQKSFVADNKRSIIEAYTSTIANGHAFPFGIYDGDIPVGFLMVGFSVDDEWTDAPAIAKGNYNIWRLMIDKNQQHKGYGRAALKLALEFIETQPCGPAECVWLSYEKENAPAKKLYASFGFEENGEMDGDEIIAVKRLEKNASSCNVIRALHHVSMKCKDKNLFEKAVSFYTEILGFKIKRRWAEGVMLESGTADLEIFCNGEGIQSLGAVRHFALATDFVDELAAKVEEAGYEVFIKPKDIVIPSEPEFHARMAFFYGPLGEQVELFCERD